jgi:hypothetical protein
MISCLTHHTTLHPIPHTITILTKKYTNKKIVLYINKNVCHIYTTKKLYKNYGESPEINDYLLYYVTLYDNKKKYKFQREIYLILTTVSIFT